jgi:hypothetical protein
MPPAPKPAAPKSLSVRVVVRCRPMSNDESVRKDTRLVGWLVGWFGGAVQDILFPIE